MAGNHGNQYPLTHSRVIEVTKCRWDGVLYLKSLLQEFINLIKLVYVYFLQRVRRAKLVQLVVHLVKNQRSVVVGGEFADSVVHFLAVQLVDYFNPVKIKDDTSLGSARHCRPQLLE